MTKKEFRSAYPGVAWDRSQRDWHLASGAFIDFYRRGWRELHIRRIYAQDNQRAPAGAAGAGQEPGA